MMVKASEMIIGLLILGLFASVLAIGMAKINDKYGTEYDNDSIQVYNQLNNLSEITEEMKDEEGSIDTDDDEVDLLGSIFDSGFQVLRITKKSFTTYDTVTDAAIKEADLGEAGYNLKIFLGAIMIILLILGVIISAIAKWYL